jgi:hypothetical protein
VLAATDAIIPVEPRYLETVGLMAALQKINDIREGWRQPNLRVSGILVTKMNTRFRLHIPADALADEDHAQQLTVTTLWLLPLMFKARLHALPQIIHKHIHPQAKIVKILYHSLISQLGLVLVTFNPTAGCLFSLLPTRIITHFPSGFTTGSMPLGLSVQKPVSHRRQ